MIPLLALGIPGEALTAMMLSVFYVHNVVPGPALFRDQLDFVYALFAAMLLLNVIVVVFIGFSSNVLARIIRIPTRFLGMIILTLSFVGVYSLRNSVVDCALAAGFGFIDGRRHINRQDEFQIDLLAAILGVFDRSRVPVRFLGPVTR